MKIIHTADLHLGSSFVNLSQSEADKRSLQLLNTFRDLVDFAKKNGVGAILLSGDVIDTKDLSYGRSTDKTAFYNIIKANPDIRFFYLRGNHDNRGKNDAEELPENLRTFSVKGWTTYTFEGLTIAGQEIDDQTTVKTYHEIGLSQNGYNIVMLHGQVVPGVFNDPSQCTGENIPISALKGRNIDYLALGHIHSFRKEQLDERGTLAYSGCLMGRGFDETGDKGFVLVDTDARTSEFIPFAIYKVFVVDVDITDAQNAQEAIDKVLKELAKIDSPQNHMVKVTLKGDVSFGPKAESLVGTLENLIRGFFYHKVVDETGRKYDFDEFKEENTLIGEFIKLVNADPSLDDEIKDRIKELGIEVLTTK